MATKYTLPSYTYGVEIECFSEKVHPAVIAWTMQNAGFKVNDLVTEDTDRGNGYEDDYEDNDEDRDVDEWSDDESQHSSGRPGRVIGQSGYDTETWTLGHDGSIEGTNPIEIKSPILRGTKGLKEIQRLTYHLNKLGVKVNQSCGLHVHVGITNADKKFATEEVVAILKRYLAHQEQIDKFLARSRRGDTNQFCAPIDGLISNIENAINPLIGPEAPPPNWAQMGRGEKLNWTLYGSGGFYWNRDSRYHQQPEPLSTSEGIQVLSRMGEHYHRVSVTPLQKYGTIEFRQHHGTVNGTKITNWIRFLLNHVEMARQITAKKKVVRGGIVKDQVFSGLPTRVRKHFIEQAKRLETPRIVENSR